jgi:hypothetical protein
MMRRGVWVPEGCGVNEEQARLVTSAARPDIWRGWYDSPWITGTPGRDGVDAGYQLSSLYALSLSWGDIAARFVEVQGKTQSLRNFVNQWKAETWEAVHQLQTWEELGESMIDRTSPHLIVPPGFSLITMGIDKQDQFYVYIVDAWSPGDNSHTLDYGEADSDEALLAVLKRKYQHADGGGSLALGMALCDSGFRPKDVHGLAARCRELNIPLQVCRGSNTPLDAFYLVKRNSQHSQNPGKAIVWVDTSMSQYWLSDSLLGKGEGKMTCWADSLAVHESFLEQLLNDAPVEKLDTTNNVKEVWQRVDENYPNDLRDCKRYSKVAMLLKTRGSRIPVRLPPTEKNKDAGQRRPVANETKLLERPGGWI